MKIAIHANTNADIFKLTEDEKLLIYKHRLENTVVEIEEGSTPLSTLKAFVVVEDIQEADSFIMLTIKNYHTGHSSMIELGDASCKKLSNFLRDQWSLKRKIIKSLQLIQKEEEQDEE